MSVKRIQDLEGELTLDHRNSPGVPAEILRQAGLPLEAGRGLYTCPTYTCGHCQRGVPVVVKAFGVRERRFVCGVCAKVLCEGCAKRKQETGLCEPFELKIERYLSQIG